MINKVIKSNKGITLVSLIITIVIMVTVAFIAINSIENDSIIDETKTLVAEYSETELKEKLEVIKLKLKQKNKLSPQVDESGKEIPLRELLLQNIVEEIDGTTRLNNYIKIENQEKYIYVDENANISMQELDLLDGYRIDQTSNSYYLSAVWNKENKNIVTLSHTNSGYMGPTAAYRCFIAKNSGLSGSTSAAPALSQASKDPMLALENGKTYKFTAKVIKVNYNDATQEVDGTLRMGCGRGNQVLANIGEYNISQITVGTEFTFTFAIDTSDYYKQVSAFYFGSSGLFRWSFDMEITLEEVEEL